ncbi:MAG: aspartate carbamoyltransferase catalytic subunit [Candidatus Fermentithermobacillus carboniphilus]|uniref:Aspartate carbamoyltransferase n=1 Tax=Candidatus Fermentithermobacillus carboniphilus TaxID=3085328 RepID=A0AAT9LES7_9FIRM|nr:MAG: aspartate carbamoyltransferase catalytic subunit [Candidatus Fermentithermobacillus carboniphilus]
MALKGKDILSLREMNPEDIELILSTARSLKEILSRPIKKVPTLRGKVVCTLFYEPSTRTRTSFELAAKYMSADTVSIATATSSVKKGETLADTARNLEVMGIDVVVMRHSVSGACHFLAKVLDVPVINAGDGMHEHPTQGLLDIFTILEYKSKIRGLKVAILGDVLHSRVARSDIFGLTKMGAEVSVAGPNTLLPPEIEALGVKAYNRVEDAVEGADVIYVLRLQLERQTKSLFPSKREYHDFFGLDRKRLRYAKEDAIVMHPGPMNRGVEISTDVADSPRSVILDQVVSGVAVRMAALYLILGGRE